jgi:hypothetical protein
MLNIKRPSLLVKTIASSAIRSLKYFTHGILPKSVTKRSRIGKFDTYSQACQDVFVRLMLNNKNKGLYVEVGAYDEIDHSNSYILERRHGWGGLSLEIDEVAVKDFNTIRSNKCICCDATKFDFLLYFEGNNWPTQIDYLSMDIEPARQTLSVLKRLPLDKYRFSVVTYEHDRYVSGPEYMDESRRIFESFGYVRVISNVLWEGRDFEDWYVDPNVVPSDVFQKYISDNIDPKTIFGKQGSYNGR